MHYCACHRLFVLALALVVVVPSVVLGQGFTGTSVASSFVVTGDATDGDILSFDPLTQTHRRSGARNDALMFGVVVDDPLLQVSDIDPVPGARPVVRVGEAVVNVSTRAGIIRTGDLVTTSDLAGLGERADRDTAGYVLGVALEDMQYASTDRTLPEGVQFGKVAVALRVGQYLPGDSMTEEPTSTEPIIVPIGQTNETGIDYFMMFRYILATVVVLLSILIALRSFGGALSQSVIAVGRNPLARSAIYSMMLWNSLFILIVSGVGLCLGIAIIVL